MVIVSHSAGSRFENPDGALLAVAFDNEFVEIAGLGRVKGIARKIIEDEDVDGGNAAQFSLEIVVESGGAEAGEELVGAGVEHALAVLDRGMAQGGGEVGLADARGPEDQDADADVREAETGQV